MLEWSLYCIDQLWCMKPSKSSNEIIKLVHGYIAKGWTEHHIKDMATYRAFNDNRGQWTLKQEGCNGSLDWGLRRPFHESVLLWHLATDFCFLLMDPLPPHVAAHDAARRSKEISNYMVYLMFVNPEMLVTGARRSLFRAMYKQLKEIPLYDDELVPLREKELAQNIINRLLGTEGSSMPDMVHDAWAIANELITSFQSDEEKLWRVVQGVWVEMLCFSAGRCRGYLHAKSLGTGGEFVSYIWLLLFYMGMETLAEKMQRPKMEEEDARNNGGSSGGTMTAASSMIVATAGSANGATAAIPVPVATGRQGDGTTEAPTSTHVMEGGDADGTIHASPVTTTTDGGDDGRTADSSVTLTPSGDENV